MPKPALFATTQGQQTAIAVVMAGVFILSLVMSWLLSNAALTGPLAPLQQTSPSTQPPGVAPT